MPSRRAYLTTLVAAGLAGCVGGSPGSTTGSPTDTPTMASGTSSRPGVTVEAAAIQYAYRHIENVDWNGIRTADGQFLFVTVDAHEAEPVPGRESFTLATADEFHDPAEIDHRYPVDLDVPGEPYTPEREDAEPRGWLMFDVPARLDTEPSLRLERDTGSWEWGLGAEMGDRAAARVGVDRQRPRDGRARRDVRHHGVRHERRRWPRDVPRRGELLVPHVPAGGVRHRARPRGVRRGDGIGG